MKNYLKPLNNESGMVLLLAMLIMSALILLGTTAVMESQTDLRISGNYKTSAMSLYAAEAGVEEARARLKDNSPSTGNEIVDGSPTDPAWTTTMTSLQAALAYTVNIQHKTSGGNVLYWGDSNGDGTNEQNTTTGQNIYLVTSTASSASASKTLEAVMTRIPPITVNAALHVQATTEIKGSSSVNGNDSCGGGNLPGIATTLPVTPDPIDVGGASAVSGSPSETYNATPMDVPAMINDWMNSANYSYTYSATKTDTGMHWGTPSGSAPYCTVNNVVYYNMNGTDLKLAGGTSGCGVLLVDGNLELNGDFNWYGIIIVSGSVTMTGTGSTHTIRGAVIAGGSAEADLVGGNTDILYCSTAISDQTTNRSLRMLSWTEQ